MRETGYYWCRIKNDWLIAFFDNSINNGTWSVCNCEWDMTGNIFDEIDEKQIKRE